MIRKLFPLIIGCFGLGGGIAAGVMLRPAPAEDRGMTADAEAGDTAAGEYSAADGAAGTETGKGQKDGDLDAGRGEETGAPEYVKLNNQFIVPVVDEGRVASMVVLSLSLEVEAGSSEAVYEREPKLRDAFLQVLFDHANTGGFSGSFTDGANLVVLRTSLQEAAALVLGATIKDVLITDIARQDS